MFTDWSTSNAKHPIVNEYNVEVAIRKFWTDKNCPAENTCAMICMKRTPVSDLKRYVHARNKTSKYSLPSYTIVCTWSIAFFFLVFTVLAPICRLITCVIITTSIPIGNNAAEGENYITYANSYLMKCTVNKLLVYFECMIKL